MKKAFFIIFAIFILSSTLVSAASPVLYFSDLIDGPESGWEGSSIKGAAVTIWGNNFGSTRGASYITVNGVQLTNDADYAEWGVTANNARGMERITFWLNSNMNNGAGTITVTVNGVTSNPLSFYVRTTGNIYFVDHNNGNDNYNGRYATFQSGTNGPFKTIAYARQQLQGGDLLYIRSGTYTAADAIDEYDSILFLAIPQNGAPNAYTAYVGYPGELPIFDDRGNPSSGGTIRNCYENTGYTVISKIKLFSGAGVVRVQSSNVGHYRIIGLDIDGLNDTLPFSSIWSGAIDPHDISDWWVYGNHVHDWGKEKYDHAFYLGNDDTGSQMFNYDIAWNEVNDLGPDVSGIYIHPQDSDGGNPKSFADNVSIHDNLAYNLEHAGILMFSRTKNISIYNNIVYNCGIQGGRDAVTLAPDPYYKTNLKFYNNVIYSYSDNSLLDIGSSNFSGDLKNNLFYSLSGTPYIYVESGAAITSNYDLFYGNGAPPSWATHSLNTNPLFVNAGNHDFHIQSSSPAKDAGSNSVASIVLKDFDGNARPQGNGFDIGAYEHVSSAPIQYHPADTNQNDIIEMKELIAFIGLWKNSQANLNDVLSALDRWMRGS